MSGIEKKVDALMRYALAETTFDQRKIREEIRSLMKADKPKDMTESYEEKLRGIMIELHAPEHKIGYEYVIEAVLLVISDRSRYQKNMINGAFREIADKHNTFSKHVERCICRLIEDIWYNTPNSILEHYFVNSVKPNKEKLTTKAFIIRLANIVQYGSAGGA